MPGKHSFLDISVLVALITLQSCATYTIPREQFYSMVHDATPETVTTKHSMGSAGLMGGMMQSHETYLSNGVKTIVCYDKHGKEVSFPNSPKVEMRITDTKGHRHVFYFDSMILQDSTFKGSNSRILGTKRHIRYADIRKVEVQKGAKAFYYAEKQ